MSFTDIFIRRPVFASAISFMILLIGLVSMANMTVRQYPEIESSVITVTTTYPGASAELMTGFVTTPLENAIGGIDNIDYMTSSNVQNQSQITVNLLVGANPDVALTNIQSKVSTVLYQLPKDIQSPVIEKNDATSNPTQFIAFQSNTMTPEQITDYLLRVVQPQIQTLDGVSQAPIFGEREYAMRINLNPALMAAHNVSPNDVFNAINKQNVQAAAGTLEGRSEEFNIVADTDMHNVEQFDNMVLGNYNNTLIRLKDVGKAMMGAENYNTDGYVDGKETVTIGVIPKATANPLAVSKEVQNLLPKLQSEMPSGLNASITYDSSVFISDSIKEVIKTIIEATLFVIAVMLLFMGSFRAVLIPLVTIPLSIIGVCGIMLALGYSINTITLLAWVLAIGLVVDDAIVVVENIHRHIEDGKNAFFSAIIGTREIGFAIIAMTFTLAAVYAPIGFSSGLTGILFREFAFTLAASVIVSGFIALTLSPMMCSKLLTHGQSKFSAKIDHIFDIVKNRYIRTLTTILNSYRMYIVAGAVVILGMGIFIFESIPGELAPTEDQGVVFTYNEGPSFANIQYTNHYSEQLFRIYDKVPEMAHYIVVTGFPSGVNTGISVLVLKDWDERKRSASQIASALAPQLWGITGLKIFGFPPPPLPGAGFMPIEYVLKTSGTDTTQRLYAAGQQVVQAAMRYPGFQHVDMDMKLDKPQINLQINRDRAADLGITMNQIATAMGTMFGSPEQNQFSMDQRSYWVIPEYDKNFFYRNTPRNIYNIYVKSSSGEMIPLSSLLKVTETVQPQSINHFQQLPSVTIEGVTNPAYTLGQDITYLNDFVNKHLPGNIQVDYAGQSRQYIESAAAMQQAFVFALLFIFLVLAAQFESYRDPFIVMTTVPLSLTGALFTLHLTGGTMNIYSEIGLITLIGLISKHGILIVEFANQIQLNKGKNIREAVLESAGLRLRPILMTTAAMVLAGIPLAYASGAGAVSRHMLGWVIVGGMTLGTIFSLFVVPTVYSLIATPKKDDSTFDEQVAKVEDEMREQEEQRKRISQAGRPEPDME